MSDEFQLLPSTSSDAKMHSEKKWCVVPMCTNTSVTAPYKYYFTLPRGEGIRKKWSQAMKRDQKKSGKWSSISALLCCEDHFNFEKDLENYMEYKMCNVRPRLKKGVLPHIFECQIHVGKSVNKSERLAAQKRKREQVVEEASAEEDGIRQQAEIAKEQFPKEIGISEEDNLDQTEVEEHQNKIAQTGKMIFHSKRTGT